MDVETGIFRKNYVTTMAADALAPRVARASAAMVLTVQVRHVLVHYEEEFQPHGPSQY